MMLTYDKSVILDDIAFENFAVFFKQRFYIMSCCFLRYFTDENFKRSAGAESRHCDALEFERIESKRLNISNDAF